MSGHLSLQKLGITPADTLFLFSLPSASSVHCLFKVNFAEDSEWFFFPFFLKIFFFFKIFDCGEFLLLCPGSRWLR